VYRGKRGGVSAAALARNNLGWHRGGAAAAAALGVA